MISSLKHIGTSSIRNILEFTSNPFIGFFIGILTTAIVQSSSTVTSLLVALVASGSVEMVNAIPVVMGANIGTTLTSDLISLGFVNNKTNFRRAIAGAATHDFFNLLTAAILLPLQISYNILGNISTYAASHLVGDNPTSPETLISGSNVESISTKYFYHFDEYAIIYMILAVVILFLSLKQLSISIVNLLRDNRGNGIDKYLFANKYKSFGWGAILTAAIQSSSVTTSLIVPFSAIGKVSVKSAFNFIMGANLGTTITALLAAVFKTEAAISIAFAHFFFNLIGVVLFLPIKQLHRIPEVMAKSLGRYTLKNRMYGFIYILLVFFLIPLVLIFLSK